MSNSALDFSGLDEAELYSSKRVCSSVGLRSRWSVSDVVIQQIYIRLYSATTTVYRVWLKTVEYCIVLHKSEKKLKSRIALTVLLWQSYGTSHAIWDHTVLPATRHRWMRPALTPASKLVLDLPIPVGWNAELTKAARQCTGRESNSRSLDHKSDA